MSDFPLVNQLQFIEEESNSIEDNKNPVQENFKQDNTTLL